MLGIEWRPDRDRDDADWDSRMTELLAFRRQQGHVQVTAALPLSCSSAHCESHHPELHCDRIWLAASRLPLPELLYVASLTSLQAGLLLASSRRCMRGHAGKLAEVMARSKWPC